MVSRSRAFEYVPLREEPDRDVRRERIRALRTSALLAYMATPVRADVDGEIREEVARELDARRLPVSGAPLKPLWYTVANDHALTEVLEGYVTAISEHFGFLPDDHED